jgi:hypothetical protein
MFSLSGLLRHTIHEQLFTYSTQVVYLVRRGQFYMMNRGTKCHKAETGLCEGRGLHQGLDSSMFHN